MIFEEQQRPTDAREQRSQCFRFCAVVMLILSTLVMVHLQQERSEEAARQRRKQRTRLASTTAWQMDRFVKQPRTVVGLAYLSPLYESAPVFFETVSRESLVIQPLLGRRATGSKLDAQNHLVGSSETVSDWVLSRQKPDPGQKSASGMRLTGQISSPHSAEILALAMDTHLHLSGHLPGCTRDDLQHSFRCYVALLRLPAEYCIPKLDGDLASKPSEISLSWTCGEAVSQDLPQVRTGSTTEKSCIHVASGASMRDISSLAKLLGDKIRNKSRTSEDPHRDDNSVRAGLLFGFCGNPFHHRIAVDWQHRRVFFAQPVPPQSASQIGGATRPSEARRLSSRDVSRVGSRGVVTGVQEVDSEQGSDSRIGGHETFWPISRRLSDKRQERRTSSVLEQTNRGGETSDHSTEPQWHSSYCVVAAYLDSFYNDITECASIPHPPGVGGRPPSHLHYDQLNQTLVTFDYDDSDSLVVSFLDAYPSKLRFSVKLQHFRTGWLLASDDASKGKMLLLGDSPPYSGILEVVDIAAQQHRRLDFLGRSHS